MIISKSLSRRLVVSKPKPSKTVGTQTIHFVADHFTRSDHQLGEIRPSASSSVHIHRDGVSDSYQYRQGTSNQTNEDIGDSQNGFAENLYISQRFPVSLGTTECCSRLCNAGTVTSPSITNVSAQSVATAETSVVSSDLYDNGNSSTSQTVVDQLPRLGKRELICLLSFTCNYVVFVWRGFLFLWVLGMGYVILLWHSLSLPYNYFSGRSLSSGGSPVYRSSLPHHIYRRQPVGLGSPCGTGGTSVSWTMDRRPIPAPH